MPLEHAGGKKLQPGESLAVPTHLMQHLADHPRLRTLEGNTELLPGVAMIDTPGHTPGHMSMVVTTEQGKVVLAQDAEILAKVSPSMEEEALFTITLR
ncbi:MAG: hypothetical protein ACYC66_16615 [Chloroflexota bacterium]